MKNDIISCRCVDLAVDGSGIARHDDLVVFVKGMIPGEEADVKIILEKKNYSVGIIDKLTLPSAYRVEPDCRIAYKCGGCDLRHIAYEQQLVLKKKLLQNTLRGREIRDIIPCDDPLHYRNKVQVPFRNGKMGFYRRNSNDIVEFDTCPLQSDKANAILSDIRQLLKDNDTAHLLRHILIKHAAKTGEVMVGLIVRSFSFRYEKIVEMLNRKYPEVVSVILDLNDKETNVILGREERTVFGRSYIYDSYDGIKVKLSLKSFYQVNHDQMEKLYAIVRDLADLDENDDVLDLYCGIGTISLYLARHAKHVTGVEIVKEAIDNAKDNAMMNGLDNADFILADASRDMDEYLKDKDIVIVDPPRKGLGRQLIDSLISSNIEKIVYVSCNPATLARDLQLLETDYQISAIQPVDMFPHTVHVETVCCLYHQKKDFISVPYEP